MPCAACGKNVISTNVVKPKSMVLGMRSSRRTVRTIQRPRGIIFNPSINNGKRVFILGR